jgi:hypothetical protein
MASSNDRLGRLGRLSPFARLTVYKSHPQILCGKPYPAKLQSESRLNHFAAGQAQPNRLNWQTGKQKKPRDFCSQGFLGIKKPQAACEVHPRF